MLIETEMENMVFMLLIMEVQQDFMKSLRENSFRAAEFGLDKIWGRAVVAGHILSNNIDILQLMKDENFLYKNVDGVFYDVASGYNVLDPYENGK